MRSPAFFLLLFFAGTVSASLERDRDRFAELRKQLDGRGNVSLAEVDALRGYILHPYLRDAWLRNGIRRAKAFDAVLARRIDQQLADEPNLPSNRYLRGAWLNKLAGWGRWDDYFAHYDPASASVTQRCHYVTGKLRRGYDVTKDAKALWSVGKSQPKACDPVFASLRQRGKLTQTLIQRRFDLAIHGGEDGLAAYLAKQLTGTRKKNAQLWLQAHRQPEELLVDATPVPGRYPQPIVVHAFQRLANRDAPRAVELWRGLEKALSGDDAGRGARHVALHAALQLHPDADTLLAQVPAAHANQSIHEWRVRNALLAGNWKLAEYWIEQMPASLRADSRWQYWRGRCQWEQGQRDAAAKTLNSLTKEAGFFSFLSADLLKQPYALQNRSLTTDAAVKQRVAGNVHIRRAFELRIQGMDWQARSEWKLGTAGLSQADIRQAAVLAADWDWYYQSVRDLGRGNVMLDYERRYPRPFLPIVSRYTQRHDLDSSWVYALMRSESLFDPRARSPVGARGLMQLMPATGKRTARKDGLLWRGVDMLYQPEPNIRLGTRYLSDMAARFDNNQILASAAYNAGPAKVDYWLPAQGSMPAEFWIERMSYGETRKYAGRVAARAVVYDYLAGKTNSRLSDRLKPVYPLAYYSDIRDANSAARSSVDRSPRR